LSALTQSLLLVVRLIGWRIDQRIEPDHVVLAIAIACLPIAVADRARGESYGTLIGKFR
jgi:hypothetical protein